MKDRPDSDILKIDDAARYLGVTRRWIYRRIWSGDLPASKVGGLYFLRKGDLETLLAQGRSIEASQPVSESSSSLLKCGYCFRLLESDTDIADACRAEGCDGLICGNCAADGNYYCIDHVQDKDALWQQAVQEYRSGKYPVLVKSDTARLREINFTERLQARLAHIDTLLHPLSDELIKIQNWDELLTSGDERSEIMKMMNKVVLDLAWISRVPLNVSLSYQIQPSAKSKASRVGLFAQVYSHSKAMLQQGFDTAQFCSDELLAILGKLGEQAKSEQIFTVAMLAATPGWDEAARQMIVGDSPGTAFSHRWLIVYLNDMESHEVIYNRLDARARAYAELFSVLLPAEQDQEIGAAIEKEMGAHESLTLAQAIEVLPYSAKSIQSAFEKMAASGRYVFMDIPELGQAIVRK